jgi:organic hydroperoxide reductase OsmC/OhrA
MENKRHNYSVQLDWTGNEGSGTSSYRAFSRSHDIRALGKPTISGSSDPAFRGDPAKWNPEELLVASLAACHQLWYLHLCAQAGIIVLDYHDDASGVMVEQPDGAGQFESVTLRPTVKVVAGTDLDMARRLHHDAAEKCFIARSVSFPVGHEPSIEIAR